MGYFDDLFDSRRNDWGQLEALKGHDHELKALDAGLQHLAHEVGANNEAANERITKVRDALLRVRTRLDRLELVSEALFLHLERKGELSRDGLRALMDEIDERDGRRDGKMKNPEG